MGESCLAVQLPAELWVPIPLQGTSPAASLKRERLVNRNAILRRTGFLEGSQGAAFLGAPCAAPLSHPAPSVGRSVSYIT
jgi:hypothetical protein